LKPKKKRERERERRENGGVAIDTTFYEGHKFKFFKFKFAATKVHRQCPLVLLVKVGFV
jgi:hypothetical protein